MKLFKRLIKQKLSVIKSWINMILKLILQFIEVEELIFVEKNLHLLNHLKEKEDTQDLNQMEQRAIQNMVQKNLQELCFLQSQDLLKTQVFMSFNMEIR